MREILPLLPASADFEILNDITARANFYQAQGLVLLKNANDVFVTTDSTTSSITISQLDGVVQEPVSVQFLSLREHYLDVSGAIPSLSAEVKKLLGLLGLDSQRGGKRPSELLSEAVAAYLAPATPGNPVASSLLPLRSSFELTLANLLSLRPVQEKASGQRQKVISIGLHLKRDFIARETVLDWADQWDKTHDSLSESKFADYDRIKWTSLMKKSLILLRAIFSGLDSTKFRTSDNG